jgi:lipid IVA palmitoyltransferase
VAENGIEAGAGVTAAVIRRHDWYDGIPFPAVLPMASIGSRSVKLNAVYMPRISVKKGKGDVVLLYLKLTF